MFLEYTSTALILIMISLPSSIELLGICMITDALRNSELAFKLMHELAEY